ncbi:MAG: Protein containing transglutaminase-like domain, putative cysteine protease [Betaproteobacteria bacterium]|nr:Protein containing transglutaminase-like domain, putative cysteine protease [Betaproteobacteria bacterium]
MSDPRRYRVLHTTGYHYSAPVALSRQLLHLTPREFNWQRVLEHELSVGPLPNESSNSRDYFGNSITHIVLSSAHQSLSLAARSIVEVTARNSAALLAGSPPWEQSAALLRGVAGGANLEPARFLYDSPHIESSPELLRYAAPSFTPRRPLLDAVLDLNHRIHEDFEFDPIATVISTPLAEVLEQRRGVCQDFAHLMIGCLRTLGLSARYVSGYLLTMPPPGHARLIGADASHAWISVYSQNGGWIDFDPTNDRLVDDEHITLGWGRDFSDVTPTRGVILGGGEQELAVHVTVAGTEEPEFPEIAGAAQTQSQTQSQAQSQSQSQSQSQTIATPENSGQPTA